MGLVELKYFAIGDPGSGYGHYTYDPILEEYNVYLKSTSSKISFKKCFAYIYSDNTFNVTEQSFIDTFEVTNENPINDGFHLGDSQGESTLMVSTLLKAEALELTMDFSGFDGVVEV